MASPRKSPKKKVALVKKKAPARKRASAKKAPRARKKRTPSRRQKPVAEEPWTWWGLLARVIVTVVLTGLAALTTVTFFQSIGAVKGFAFLTTAPVFFFVLGMLVMPLLVWGFSEFFLYLYVFGHELTHVVFIYLCGGKVFGDIRVSVTGGHVLTNKSNWLISLSPYFVPFYTVIVGTGFLVASLLVDLGATHEIAGLLFQPLYLFYALIGFTWSLHIFYTMTMLMKDQPDLHMNGTLVSLLVIYLVNSIVVISFVTFASETLTIKGFLVDWYANLSSILTQSLVRIAGLIW